VIADDTFVLDRFQTEAIAALGAGRSVVVAAPTGAGKTVVAEHAVTLALAQGQRVFYTTPIKALSNQKFHDLRARHGAKNVGLLTGDNAIQADAPVVIMTTEVLRNMIYAGSQALHDLRYVVLDEVHFLQDTYRGPVWEEVIIHIPPWVRLVCLSATVSNAAELADWVSTVRGPTDLVVETRRPVTLDHLYLAGDASADALQVLPLLVDGRSNPQGARFDETRDAPSPGRRKRRFFAPNRLEVADLLAERRLLPALYFIFSRNACDDAVKACLAGGLRLTTADERLQIRLIVDEHIGSLPSDDLNLLGADAWAAAMEQGIAAHHAGLIPPFKEAVEACFVRGLVKLVFATETLALGINMPARCVVIEKLTKFTGERHEFLTPGQYTQLTGRAGRRGIDEHGTAIVLWSPFTSFADTAALAGSTEFYLRSAFRPTYNMAVNLVRRCDPDEARRLLNLSFAQFQADRSVVRLEARLATREASIAELRAAATCERGDVVAYLVARDEADADARRRREEIHQQLDRAIRHLRPGHIVRLPTHRGERPAVVLSLSERRASSVRLRLITANGRTHNIGAADFDVIPEPIGFVDLPTPYAPTAPVFQRQVAELLRARSLPSFPALPVTNEETVDGEADDPHGVGGCPDLPRHLRAAKRVRAAERELADLRRQVRGHTDSLSLRFEAVLQLLEAWGYLDGWSLTERGQLLAGIFHESDLLVAEAVAEGLFDGLDAAEMAAVASTLTYEHRSPLPPDPPWYPTGACRARVEAIANLASELNADEEQLRLGVTRTPDPTFVASAHAWSVGSPLEQVLEDEGLSPGDFVRNVKQLVDLLRQIGEASSDGSTRRTARDAAQGLLRGVVALSVEIGADRQFPLNPGALNPGDLNPGDLNPGDLNPGDLNPSGGGPEHRIDVS